MKAIVACPGPSLATAAIAGFDLLIGVNRAPVIRKDWLFGAWVANDIERMAEFAPSYPVDLCTCEARMQRYRKRTKRSGSGFVPRTVKFYRELSGFDPAWQWDQFSFTAAIIYAAWREATLIDCIGCDWTNAPDADGVNLLCNVRNDHRWNRERRIFDRVVSELSLRGIQISRIVP